MQNKPKSVEINKYLLLVYGYLHCNVCNTIKSVDEFNSNTSNTTKKSGYCKSCHTLVQKTYRHNNREVVKAAKARRRATELNASPPWLTATQKQEILEIYRQSVIKNMEVDHIVPLQGENICGLHVPWNLQLLTKEENARKSNKVDWNTVVDDPTVTEKNIEDNFK